MIWKWLKRLFSRPPKHGVRNTSWPTRDEIALLPPFDGLTLDNIVVVSTPQGAKQALDELSREIVVGFDTESKPTFVKGQVSTGPHVAQFATGNRAYVFMLHQHHTREAAKTLIALESLKKVGFGLNHDLKQIPIRLHVQPKAILDLETIFREKGFGRGVGVKVAVAIKLKRRFAKSKKASTSNWMNHRLTYQQVLYAANDAYAAIKVYDTFADSSAG
jgi:ribonuclease D